MSQTKIFAHRGFSSQFPENTMIAFQTALEVGVDGIEFDVQLSKDHVPVIIHDHTLDRTSTGSGVVGHYSLQELKQFSAGSWFHEQFKEEQIPTLEEIFLWATNNALQLNVELKGYVWERQKLISIVFPLIKKYGLQNRVIVSSFDHKVIHLWNKQFPTIETGIIVKAALHNPKLYVQQIATLGYHFYYMSLTTEEAEQLINSGIRLRPYTVNDKNWIRTFVNLKCEAIITDYPDLALSLR
ncbi:glycerophosphodiester phosphodiesterase [Halalkalibacter kiskunsagensis]|uniref:Glycerophosphodiester phosphodiesterase n=1 Tax=Halalkalibacter kiskunsagensis TaxID=1548599 RepID=A0ABV6KGF4_9BACI